MSCCQLLHIIHHITSHMNKHNCMRYIYSLARRVKRTPSILVLDIRITMSFMHQTSDYIEMSTAGVKNIHCQSRQLTLSHTTYAHTDLLLCLLLINVVYVIFKYCQSPQLTLSHTTYAHTDLWLCLLFVN